MKSSQSISVVDQFFSLESDPIDDDRILTKIDLHLLPFISIFYIFSILERVNIGNARIIGFKDGSGELERNLGMSSSEYNW